MSAKSTEQPVTDDQELAKVLATNAAQQKSAADDALGGLQFEEPPVPTSQTASSTPASTTPSITPSPSAAAAKAQSSAAASTPATPTAPPPATNTPSSAPATSSYTPVATGAGGSLEELKKDALEELRPLVSKLNLPADEKFDTLLLIIRSTDDQSLLGAAHDAAKAIPDESRRAQALLDVIKEIDYFSGQTTA